MRKPGLGTVAASAGWIERLSVPNAIQRENPSKGHLAVK